MNQTITQQDPEVEINAANWGKHYIDYITHMLAIVQEPETLAVIARVKKMSHEDLQKFNINVIPVPDQYFKIKGFRITRTLKTEA